MVIPEPRRPSSLSTYAEMTLLALEAAKLGHTLSLGGALGLQHYLEYRPTDDVDAWWASSATTEDRDRVIRTVDAALGRFGETRLRKWGDVVSLDLKVEGRVAFSFQVAVRSAQLEPTTTLPWADVALDSFSDLVASKMVALVERGAPRDFRDIYALCQAGLLSAAESWRLWRLRQRGAGSDTDAHRARLAVETHLARIAQHRPLQSIVEAQSQAEAERVRAWFLQEFLDALVD